jgi:hypothetical protein
MKKLFRFLMLALLPVAAFFLAYFLIGPRIETIPVLEENKKGVNSLIKSLQPEEAPPEEALPEPVVKVTVENTRARRSTPEITVISEGIDPADRNASGSTDDTP